MARGHARGLRAWRARTTTPTHHGSASTALGVDARAAGHNTPWVIPASSARCWGSSTPMGQKDRMPQYRHRKVPLGELLCQAGLLTAEQLTQALTAQKTRRPAVPFGQLCIELGFVSAAQLGSVLSKHGRRLFLGEWLALTGVITPAQLRAALRQQLTQGSQKQPLGALLIAQGWLTDTTLQQALTQQAQLADKTIYPFFQKFGTLLTNECLSPQDLLAAIVEAHACRCPVDTVLMERYQITKQEIGYALSTFYQCPLVAYDEKRPLTAPLLRGIN